MTAPEDAPRHLLFHVDSSSQTRGADWLRYYKLYASGETFVSVPEDAYPEARPKDFLWFQVDNSIVAYVPLLRIQTDHINSRTELWYMGEHVTNLPKTIPGLSRETHHIISPLGLSWIANVKTMPPPPPSAGRG